MKGDGYFNHEQCACCGFRTLKSGADYEVCPVCFWEDDGLGESEPDKPSGPNHELSLSQARANFKAVGACHSRFVSKVRAPLPHERDA